MISFANRGDAIKRDDKRKSRDSQILQSQPGRENLYSKEPTSVTPSPSLVYAQLSISLCRCDLYQVNGPHEAGRLQAVSCHHMRSIGSARIVRSYTHIVDYP